MSHNWCNCCMEMESGSYISDVVNMALSVMGEKDSNYSVQQYTP